MLFGMGMTLTDVELLGLKGVVHPCHACLGLANDYFSFDREYADFDSAGGRKLINAVWLFMQWQRVDAATAKQIVKKVASEYEGEFLRRWDEWKTTQKPPSQRLEKYLEALSYMVSGNVYWSLNCPRYNPHFRYDIDDAADSEGYHRRLSTTSSSRDSLVSHRSEMDPDDSKIAMSTPSSPATPVLCLAESAVLGLDVSFLKLGFQLVSTDLPL
jgi:hypothetical protein